MLEYMATFLKTDWTRQVNKSPSCPLHCYMQVPLIGLWLAEGPPGPESLRIVSLWVGWWHVSTFHFFLFCFSNENLEQWAAGVSHPRASILLLYERVGDGSALSEHQVLWLQAAPWTHTRTTHTFTCSTSNRFFGWSLWHKRPPPAVM